MFTSIAVATIDPVSIVFFRVLIGALVLGLAVWLGGLIVPVNKSAWLSFLLIAISGNLLPFFLIAWGQKTIDSGMAGTIMAVMPLITMLLAHFFVAGETLNRYKFAGFCMGILGVALLLGPVFGGSQLELFSSLAIFIAACSYAVNTVLIRRAAKTHPMVSGASVLTLAAVVLLPVWLLKPVGVPLEASSGSVASLVWLGIGPTGLATIVLFFLVERAGPTFVSTMNYLIPVVAFFCGVILLSEPLGWSSVVALVMILAGIAVTRKRISSGHDRPV